MDNSNSNTKPIIEEDFLTDPLAGLCPLPAHEMTDDQRRAHILQIRQMRQSHQVFKTEVEEFEKVKERKVKKESKKVTLDGMDELF